MAPTYREPRGKVKGGCKSPPIFKPTTMKTFTNDHDNAKYSHEQAMKVMELLSTQHLSSVGFKRIECFQYDGIIFKGNYDIAVNAFVNQTEVADFLSYLKETHYQFTYLYA